MLRLSAEGACDRADEGARGGVPFSPFILTNFSLKTPVLHLAVPAEITRPAQILNLGDFMPTVRARTPNRVLAHQAVITAALAV